MNDKARRTRLRNLAVLVVVMGLYFCYDYAVDNSPVQYGPAIIQNKSNHTIYLKWDVEEDLSHQPAGSWPTDINQVSAESMMYISPGETVQVNIPDNMTYPLEDSTGRERTIKGGEVVTIRDTK